MVWLYCRWWMLLLLLPILLQPFRWWPRAMGTLPVYYSCFSVVCDTLVSRSLSTGHKQNVTTTTAACSWFCWMVAAGYSSAAACCWMMTVIGQLLSSYLVVGMKWTKSGQPVVVRYGFLSDVPLCACAGFNVAFSHLHHRFLPCHWPSSIDPLLLIN